MNLEPLLDYFIFIIIYGNILINDVDIISKNKSLEEKTGFGMPLILPTPLVATNVSNSIIIDKENNNVESRILVEMERRGKKAPRTEVERSTLIHNYHVRGHFGRDAIVNKLYEDGYWWPGMRRMIDIELRDCDACIRYVVSRSGYHPAESITSMLPGDHWQVDCSSHMPESPDGFTAILHVVDVFTGFILLLKPMKDITAVSVAKELIDLICLMGPPKIIQSDNGPEFANDTVRAVNKLIGSTHRHITPYNPRADGKVEKSVGTTTMVVKKLLHGSDQVWPLFVPYAQLTYNNKVSSLTGSTPFSLYFGRRMNDLKDYSNDLMPTPINLDDWKHHQEKLASLVYPAISDKMKVFKSDMIKRMNKHRRLLTESIPSGAIVMVKDPHRENKFEPKYIGPYTVLRRAQNGAYVLRDQTGDIFDRHVTADQLKLIAKSARKKDQEDEGNVYIVDRISDHRGRPGSYEFLTYWKGYTDPTWVKEQDFIDHACIRKYWKSVKQRNSQ